MKAAICVATLALAIALAGGESHIFRSILKQNSTLESILKNTGFILNYIGLVTQGELSLRAELPPPTAY